VLLKRLKEVTV
jgi:hypothetical protein